MTKSAPERMAGERNRQRRSSTIPATTAHTDVAAIAPIRTNGFDAATLDYQQQIAAHVYRNDIAPCRFQRSKLSVEEIHGR